MKTVDTFALQESGADSLWNLPEQTKHFEYILQSSGFDCNFDQCAIDVPATNFDDEQLISATQTPSFVPGNQIHPLSLLRTGPDNYIVQFSTVLGIRSYEFSVNTEVVPVVSWQPEFRDFIGDELSSVTALLDAILAFHESQNVVRRI